MAFFPRVTPAPNINLFNCYSIYIAVFITETMMVPKTLSTAVLAAVLSASLPSSYAAYSAQDAITGLTSLAQQVDSASTTLNSFHGGYMGALTCAREIFTVQQACKQAQQLIDGSGQVPEEDIQQYVDQIDTLHESVTNILSVAAAKVRKQSIAI
ncbi:hypothetical protein BGW36DRAFT_370550 [Talaromyces proteolyticus]|uniref:Uncharacterized protein n=1 Tax=Talaromyces proteolyticus TaxID=1131652 RepID=A0AAD4L202_9EURO|nr:uncharacterized protein BGW36DRAFT_370550 [Talaromyces proteolyticus]KAH8704085.1 hypothetical protein BGW36DRAFT_370550 [Talaromyces proteolyticus]